MDTHLKYQALKARVTLLAHQYYVQDAPSVSDAEYDSLFRELQAMEQAHPEWVASDSPTQRVGGTLLEGFQEVRHRLPMLSLDNALNQDEAAEFVRKLSGLVGVAVEDLVFFQEPKYDGAACSIAYEFGRFVEAATRGDGETGENVTAQVKTIRNVPLFIPALESVPRFEVRGEVLMRLADFDEINRHRDLAGERPFVNTRNAAAGALRQLDPSVTAQRRLRFYAYALGICDGIELPATQGERIAWLAQLGFEGSPDRRIVRGLQGLQDAFSEMSIRRAQLPFEIDGVVFKLDDVALQVRAGWNSRVPKWAIAYKFPPQEQVTVLEAIDIQVGRTGKLTPVGRLRPVFVGGVTVSNVTLHNLDEIRRKDVRVGDSVVIRRAGDVIPELPRVLTELRTSQLPEFDMPKACPVCGSAVHKEADKANHFCSGGLSCSAQRLFALTHFASRLALDIEGLAEGVVQKLIDAQLLARPSDLYKLDFGRVAMLEGFGAVSAQNLAKAIDATKGVPFNRFIYALGIHGVGESTAKDLARRYDSLELLAQASFEELQTVRDIGPATASNIRNFFENPSNADEAQSLAAAVAPAPLPRTEGQVFNGKTFVITGTLSAPREAFKARIEAAGGKVSGSVSAKTNYLLAGAEAGSKLAKAQSLNVAVLDEATFEAMLQG